MVNIPGLNTSSITNAQVTNRSGNTPRVGEHFLAVSRLHLFESSNDKGKIFVGEYLVRESSARPYGRVTLSETSQGLTEASAPAPHTVDETVSTVWARKFVKQDVDRWNSNVKSLMAAIKGTLFNLIAMEKDAGKTEREIEASRNFYAQKGWDMSTPDVTDSDVAQLLSATWDGEGALPAERRADMLDMFRSLPVKCIVTRIVKREAKTKSRDAYIDSDLASIISFVPVSKEELARKESVLFPDE